MWNVRVRLLQESVLQSLRMSNSCLICCCEIPEAVSNVGIVSRLDVLLSVIELRRWICSALLLRFNIVVTSLALGELRVLVAAVGNDVLQRADQNFENPRNNRAGASMTLKIATAILFISSFSSVAHVDCCFFIVVHTHDKKPIRQTSTFRRSIIAADPIVDSNKINQSGHSSCSGRVSGSLCEWHCCVPASHQNSFCSQISHPSQ
jgi:hypothetical protein